MLQEAESVCGDISILKRLSFAASFLPKDTPRYWDFVTRFGFQNSTNTTSIEKVKTFLDNVQYIDEKAFKSEDNLLKELTTLSGFDGHQLGIVLISTNKVCRMCGGKLLARADRPSFPYLYSDRLGSVTCTHFRKYCQNSNRGCSYTQHYGFHMCGDDSVFEYDRDCFDLPYFVATHMTVFDTQFLQKINAEVLIAHTSYRQLADIYNYNHGYESTLKSSMMPHEKKDDSETNRCTGDTYIHSHTFCTYSMYRCMYMHMHLCVYTHMYLYGHTHHIKSISH